MDMIDEKDYDCGLQIRDPNQQGLGRPQVWDMFCQFV